MAGELPFETPLVKLREKILELEQFGSEKGIDFTEEIARLEERYRQLEEEIYNNISPSQKMHLARHHQRPTSLDMIGLIFEDFIELHGDRVFGDDLAVVGGLAKLGGMPVTVIGQQRGRIRRTILPASSAARIRKDSARRCGSCSKRTSSGAQSLHLLTQKALIRELRQRSAGNRKRSLAICGICRCCGFP